MQKLYLFYVESNFHLLLSLSYISYKEIKKDDVLFITHRGVRLPEMFDDRILYDGTECQFGARIKLYRSNRERFKTIFEDKKVVSFSPFQFRFPASRYFSQYCFIEEGFSAYACRTYPVNWKAIWYEWSKMLYLNLLLPFTGQNIKGFLMGISPSLAKAKEKYDVIVCSEHAYTTSYYSDMLNKIVVPIRKKEITTSNIKNATILIMDRLNPNGRPFNDNRYLAVLKGILLVLGDNGRQLLVKMHPSDFKHPECIDRAKSFFEMVGVKIRFIDDNLEEIAHNDSNNTFIGTNSTILYYAPILGASNKSISFAKQLAAADPQYVTFLQGWGGVDEFCRIFSNQVKCI